MEDAIEYFLSAVKGGHFGGRTYDDSHSASAVHSHYVSFVRAKHDDIEAVTLGEDNFYMALNAYFKENDVAQLLFLNLDIVAMPYWDDVQHLVS